MSTLSSPNDLLSKEELLLRLEEAEETLRAIRSGEVDALVVSGAQGDQVFTLKDAKQPYQILIEEMNEGALTLSPQGIILYCNARFGEMLGLPMQAVLGQSFLHLVNPDDLASARELLEHRPDGKSRGELRLLGNQLEVPVGISLKEIKLDSEMRLGVVITDFTERKRAESELMRHQENLEMLVKERTSELEELNRELVRSNENLEQFAYVASHDLQEPLRVMSNFSQLLEKRYKDRLDQDANEFIDFIVDAAARMQKLITDLLAYSRAGRDMANPAEVDCNKVLRRLVDNMAVTIEAADGCVTFDNLPSVMAHETSLTQLFQNLIGNALKFRGEQPPRIHVSARQAHREWVFSVQDNGIGIEPQYSGRIFMIFQRLHARSKYPGTGIGLSICKKIVENLGGRIWVESEPGQGSTFSFTLPIRKE